MSSATEVKPGVVDEMIARKCVSRDVWVGTGFPRCVSMGYEVRDTQMSGISFLWLVLHSQQAIVC